jgi:hypothetical protein
MKIKSFSVTGKAAIDSIERQVNEWLAQNPSARVIDRHVAMCAGADREDGELVQSIFIVIWYSEGNAG